MADDTQTTMPLAPPLRALMALKRALAEFYGAPPTDQMLAQWWRDMWEAENDAR